MYQCLRPRESNNSSKLESLVTGKRRHAKPGGLIPDSMHFPQPASQHGSRLMFLSSLLSTAPFLSLPLKIRKQFCSYLVLPLRTHKRKRLFMCVPPQTKRNIFCRKSSKIEPCLFPFSNYTDSMGYSHTVKHPSWGVCFS